MDYIAHFRVMISIIIIIISRHKSVNYFTKAGSLFGFDLHSASLLSSMTVYDSLWARAQSASRRSVCISSMLASRFKKFHIFIYHAKWNIDA